MSVSAIQQPLSFEPVNRQFPHLISGVAKPLGTFHPFIDISEDSTASFAKARELDPLNDHGFISEAQLRIRLLHYAGRATGKQALLAAANSDREWLRNSFQATEDLLSSVRLLHHHDTENEYEQKCRAELDALYGHFDQALQTWDNLLNQKGVAGTPNVYSPPIRRQIVWTLLARKERDWSSLPEKEVSRIASLVESNLEEEPNDERNMRLWMQASRHLQSPPSIDAVIEKLGYWRASSDSMEPVYYLYVLYTLLALEGSAVAQENAERILEECRTRSRYRRDRTRSFEWVGKAPDLKKLVHQDKLGGWNPATDFWNNEKPLSRVSGKIVKISGPQSGVIELAGGIKAFFVPGASGHTMGKSENRRVTTFLGFSYDGPRAWSVHDEDELFAWKGACTERCTKTDWHGHKWALVPPTPVRIRVIDPRCSHPRLYQ